MRRARLSRGARRPTDSQTEKSQFPHTSPSSATVWWGLLSQNKEPGCACSARQDTQPSSPVTWHQHAVTPPAVGRGPPCKSDAQSERFRSATMMPVRDRSLAGPLIWIPSESLHGQSRYLCLQYQRDYSPSNLDRHVQARKALRHPAQELGTCVTSNPREQLRKIPSLRSADNG